MTIVQYAAGYIAFFTSIIGLFPQIHKAWRTKSTHDISLIMLINFLICSIAWVIYGFTTDTYFVLMSNVIGLISCMALIVMKQYYDDVRHD